MQEVHIYAYSANKSTSKKETKCFYKLETQTTKGQVSLENEFTTVATAHQAAVRAVIEALKRINRPCRVFIHTDSAYVVAEHFIRTYFQSH